LVKLVAECQTILDFTAAINDGWGGGAKCNSVRDESSSCTTTRIPTLSF